MSFEKDKQTSHEEMLAEPDDISPDLKAWTKKVLEITKRASTAEEYRKELARRTK